MLFWELFDQKKRINPCQDAYLQPLELGVIHFVPTNFPFKIREHFWLMIRERINASDFDSLTHERNILRRGGELRLFPKIPLRASKD